MSEKSEFQIAFDKFQKDITNTLFELSASSDFFRECSTLPLARTRTTAESTVRAKPKNTKKATKEEDNGKVEKADKIEKKREEDEEKKEAKDKQEKEWTQEEIDNEIIASSKRTQADLTSSKFMRNLKKRIKNVESSLIKARIETLLEEGKIINDHKDE